MKFYQKGQHISIHIPKVKTLPQLNALSKDKDLSGEERHGGIFT